LRRDFAVSGFFIFSAINSSSSNGFLLSTCGARHLTRRSHDSSVRLMLPPAPRAWLPLAPCPLPGVHASCGHSGHHYANDNRTSASKQCILNATHQISEQGAPHSRICCKDFGQGTSCIAVNGHT
jgi:hypothetical protein